MSEAPLSSKSSAEDFANSADQEKQPDPEPNSASPASSAGPTLADLFRWPFCKNLRDDVIPLIRSAAALACPKTPANSLHLLARLIESGATGATLATALRAQHPTRATAFKFPDFPHPAL